MLKTRRICLWSGPRNISTALMYSFAQREDITIFDEPLYGHYLKNSDASKYHPGAEEVMAEMETDGQKVIDDIFLGEYDTPVVFFKNMAHHLVNLDWTFMEETINVILTRDPRDMLPSYIKIVENPELEDLGYSTQLKIKNYVKDELGQDPIVVDAKDILMYPQSRIRELCATMGIPFDNGMLSWPAGPRKEDGVWAKHWYHNVHRSTGFKQYKSSNEPIPDRLEELYEEADELYQKLIS